MAAAKKKIDEFLAIASKHHIRRILVLFDSSWEPNPHLGPQASADSALRVHLGETYWQESANAKSSRQAYSGRCGCGTKEFLLSVVTLNPL